MSQTIDHRCKASSSRKYLAPILESDVGSHHEGPVLIPPAHDLEKEVSRLTVKGEVTHCFGPKGIREIIKANPTCRTENLIHRLNPKIIDWSNYFRHVVSKETFSYVDSKIFWAIWAWARRRHHNRSKQWIWQKYFPNPDVRGNLTVLTSEGEKPKAISLARASTIPIRRHIKIKGEASPHDPRFKSYFEMRDKKKGKSINALPIF